MQSNRELFEAYSKTVYRTCYYMVQDASDAEDLCQEIFITLFRSDWQCVEHLKAWIMKITVNTCLNHLKRSQSLRQKIAQNLHLWGSAKSEEPVERLVEQKETAQEWAGYMSRLPAKIRAVLTLRYMHDFSLAEIAEALSIPVGTAKSRQHKGIKMMRGILLEAGFKNDEWRGVRHEEAGSYARASVK
ncbi:RNA polymerase sigma factor [Paenibacillus sp. FSL R7-0331]|uniref:RNA polymerase sigma factor n=1 Tax=Paenibacillus sp. FSL R7-0331 TaxID=1536773 RepID=UPI0004F730F7|nr:RNA polymerase sigma factor [Paenibacillus sp. FSL R7-0331]AIQ54263.1 DNA-directed RNA polymerase subunit sigma [Paenibacillus sp. FSL R7-0331]